MTYRKGMTRIGLLGLIFLLITVFSATAQDKKLQDMILLLDWFLQVSSKNRLPNFCFISFKLLRIFLKFLR